MKRLGATGPDETECDARGWLRSGPTSVHGGKVVAGPSTAERIQEIAVGAGWGDDNSHAKLLEVLHHRDTCEPWFGRQIIQIIPASQRSFRADQLFLPVFSWEGTMTASLRQTALLAMATVGLVACTGADGRVYSREGERAMPAANEELIAYRDDARLGAVIDSICGPAKREDSTFRRQYIALQSRAGDVLGAEGIRTHRARIDSAAAALTSASSVRRAAYAAWRNATHVMIAARTLTHADGNYSLRLSPGNYVLAVEIPSKLAAMIYSSPVTVRIGKTRLDLTDSSTPLGCGDSPAETAILQNLSAKP